MGEAGLSVDATGFRPRAYALLPLTETLTGVYAWSTLRSLRSRNG